MSKSALGIIQKYHPNVKSVVDATEPLYIEVTKKDCKNGSSKEPGDCVIARACRREYEGAVISMSVAYIVDGETAYRYMVPQSIAREVVSFDRAGMFQPGLYSLNAPVACQRLGAHLASRPRSGKKKTVHSRKKRNHATAGIRRLAVPLLVGR